MTQQSVIQRPGMAEVIKGFRDGRIVAVEWLALLDMAHKLDNALEELIWSIYILQTRSLCNSKYLHYNSYLDAYILKTL